MNTPRIVIAKKIFTGDSWLNDSAVIINDGIVEALVPVSSLAKNSEFDNYIKEIFQDCFVVPAFIDLQIYGAAGKLFVVYPEEKTLSLLHDHCCNGGAFYCLPTVATNTMDVLYDCVDAVKNFWKISGRGILGLHIEGPWINLEKRGAHIESLIHSPSLEEVKSLLNHGEGVIKMITLAPEICSKEIIRLILSHDIIISAGHSNASYKQALAGFENGISAVTHLYNAMSPLHHREPGLVGAAFDSNKIFASIIPDGHHVDYSAIRIAKKIMGNRLFAITDAVTESAEGHYHHQLKGDKYEAGGILSGSALTMNKALQNLINFAGIDLDEALRMCSFYPAQLMKIENKLGRIEKNYEAKLTILNENLEMIKLIS